MVCVIFLDNRLKYHYLHTNQTQGSELNYPAPPPLESFGVLSFRHSSSLLGKIARRHRGRVCPDASDTICSFTAWHANTKHSTPAVGKHLQTDLKINTSSRQAPCLCAILRPPYSGVLMSHARKCIQVKGNAPSID